MLRIILMFAGEKKTHNHQQFLLKGTASVAIINPENCM